MAAVDTSFSVSDDINWTRIFVRNCVSVNFAYHFKHNVSAALGCAFYCVAFPHVRVFCNCFGVLGKFTLSSKIFRNRD